MGKKKNRRPLRYPSSRGNGCLLTGFFIFAGGVTLLMLVNLYQTSTLAGMGMTGVLSAPIALYVYVRQRNKARLRAISPPAQIPEPQRRSPSQQQPPSPQEHARSREKTVILLAKQKGGILNAFTVAAECGWMLEDAEAELDRLVSLRAASIEYRNTVKQYRFAFVSSPSQPAPSPEPQPSPSSDMTVTCWLTGKTLAKTPEEIVRQQALRTLSQQGYAREDMAVEFPIRMGRSRKRADIVIFSPGATHEQAHILAIIEAKAATVSEEETAAGKEQLHSYVAASMNCQYAALVGATWQAFAVRSVDGHRRIVPLSEFPGCMPQ